MKRIVTILVVTGIISQAFGLPSDDKSSTSAVRSNPSVTFSFDTPFSPYGKGYSDMHDRNCSKHWDEQDKDNEQENGARYFRGHWAGIEFGFNSYTFKGESTLPQNLSYMTLNTSASNCFNLNFSQINLGFSRHMGIVTGIGLNWNNYRFEHGNSIAIGQEGYITPVFFPDTPPAVKKSKFAVLYLNVPVLFEAQLPAGFSGHLNIAAGVIGGIKLNAWTKVVYEDKDKSRINGDYNLNLLRGGVHARVGYGNFTIFGTYYLSQWFQDLKGPEGLNLEPFEIGLAFTFND